MINEFIMKRQIGDSFLKRGKNIYLNGLVHNLDIIDNPSGITHIEGLVESERTDTAYFVQVSFGRNGNLITYDCDCPYFLDHNTPCKHIAAVLYNYIDEDKLIQKNPNKKPVKLQTNPAVTELIHDLSDTSIVPQQNQLVSIESYTDGTDGKGNLLVDFKVGYPKQHMYVIQSLDSFLMAFENKEKKKYGKFLTLVHTLEAFDATSQKLIRFLQTLFKNEDSFKTPDVYPFYYHYYNQESYANMKRTIYLRGRYLDEYISIIQDQRIYLDDKEAKVVIPCHIVDEMPPIHAHLEKVPNGYNFIGDSWPFARGNQYLYFFEYDLRKIYRVPREKKSQTLFQLLREAKAQPMFVSEEDLPKFSKYVYPILSTKTQFTSNNYDPYDYTIEPPTFEIYLDYPQENTITAQLKAVYSNAVYNIFSKDNLNKRDSDEEKKFEQMVSSYFTSFDEINKQFVLQGEDDEMYTFMSETIPYMQSIATVYISDKLKKLTIQPMSKVSVGVSLSHDLLQLNLVSDELTMPQVAEILSKYNKKKKFFRLKDGTFLNMQDSGIEELMSLKDTLALSKTDISKGKVKLPKYRAMYLDNLESTQAYNLDYDTGFRQMIQKMEEINQEEYVPPVDIQATLRPYQLDGMRWLCALRDNGFGGLLADEMGLGKTLQVISMLGNWKNRKKTLIVCPASLVYNWSKEIEKFLPSLKHRMIQGTQEERKQLIESAKEDEVLITSYDLLRRDIEYYEDMRFSCEVIDEAQYIKNATTLTSKAVKEIQADFKIALTGTPIENRLSELWSIFDYLMPGFFYGYETFRKRFEMPIVKDNDDLMERELNQMITPFVLRRLKNDVLKDLPDKLEEVYYAPLEGEQKQLYQAEVQKIKLILEKQTDQEFKENKMVILAELTKLRQLCCHPGLLYANYHENSAKTNMCVDLVMNAIEGGHKILLFSQFTSMLDALKERLNENNIPYYLLEGKTPKKKRSDMVDAFQKDDVPVFLISLKAGGTGLNLTAADIVIHYDPWWNTAVENQASDRAHRIGQTNIVTVYKLIMKDTIEERILELQNQKSDLANRILSGDGMSSSKLSREDLLALL